MISLDDHPPPDPSSSHHHQLQQQSSHDLKVSDIDLKSPDPDLDDANNPTPNFSIRDYVFSLRSKNVACNWPFSHRSLQLCLTHGVKNLLPPFQNLDLLRDNSCLSKCSLENRLPDEEFVSIFHGKSTENQLKSNRERTLGSVNINLSGSKRDSDSQFHFQEPLAHTRSKEKPPASSQKTKSIKKSKLTMKLKSGVEPVEEVAPNSFIVSETMASKVCPVCKIFTSSSNTTLNAHIDQCLTGERTMKWTDNPKVIAKHRLKPRKTRLMVDIYETAPYCTVEELDRRNGTSWATNLSFPAQEFEYQGEQDKEDKVQPRMNTINPVIADSEGDVYIDTDGTKVRILSMPKTGSSDDHIARKLPTGVKGSKIVMGKKKGSILKQKRHQKYLKLSPNARKLCSLKLQVRNCQEEDVITENCSKDERRRDPINAQVHMKVADLAIVRLPWACSKRTDIAKKLSGKQQKLELESRATKDLLIESDKSSSRWNLGTPSSLFNNVASSKSQNKLRTTPTLIVQQALTSNITPKFRKERTRTLDDCEGSPDPSPSQHSDGADFRSKGRKFLYLRRNFSFSEANITLKRKLSSVKKPRVLCLLNEKCVDEPSHDSLEEQSRMEERTCLRRKEETRSITSKSSNEESVDVLPDLESIRNDTLSDTEQVCAIPGSFFCLGNSLTPEFSRQECIGMYQDSILGSTNCSPDGRYDIEKHDNYYHEVDPIQIPGPPGSFLPSPGGETISKEQLQVNSSSTTTIRVLSCENHHHDGIDQDSMSTSPVSDVSNPSLARSDSRSSEKLAYKSTSDDGTCKKSLPNDDTSFKSGQPCCCSLKDASGEVRNFDQGLHSKESSFSYTVASNHQDLSILRKPVVEFNGGSSGLNFIPESCSLGNCPTSPASAIIPMVRVPPAYSYCDSAVGPSKPVLRLMGKNLTVVKTDEDVSSSSQQFRPLQSSQHLQRPIIFSHYQNGSESQNSNVYPQINMTRNLVDLTPSNGGFMPMVDRYSHSGLFMGPTIPEAKSYHGHNGASGSKPVKEMIVIDDFSENEGDSSMRKEFVGRNWGQMKPLYTTNQPPYGGTGGGSSVFRGDGFQSSLSSEDLGKWKLGPSSPLPSTSHL